MSRPWIGVASAEHVRRGRSKGFMQIGHGKGAPLRRLSPGDGIADYSPTEVYGQTDRLQSFTTIGHVRPGEVYKGDMGGGFMPFRRDVAWLAAREAPIAPLLERLEFTAGKSNWGYQFRFGLFSIRAADFRCIADAMAAQGG